ncbi:hypothetical protein SAMN05444422_105291 [Halobiforma haloterrestris]|uniref:Uncharacterized protein n=2 Tax=Natronobacterium haloterrestre TaxID=148448 RepID=A0A1I1HAH8_NATHA|nr:hypothetical protein SAMN05444422_105291 [Halobiforma haloterrestris]
MTFGAVQLQLMQSSERDIIWMANGSTSATYAAYRMGARVGYTAMNTRPPEDVEVSFVDFPFKRLEEAEVSVKDVFEPYLQVVKQEQPEFAVIPDINNGVTFEDALSLAYEVAPHCETLIMVPKSVHPSRIPSHIRVGIPCQSKFAESPWSFNDYRKCEELHLFGGSPHDHFEIVFENGLTQVESMDTSVPISSAQWGDAWTLTPNGPRWKSAEGGVYGCLEATFREMCRVFNRDRPSTPSKRHWVPRPHRGRYESIGYPDDDLLHPEDNQPFAGREYHIARSIV